MYAISDIETLDCDIIFSWVREWITFLHVINVSITLRLPLGTRYAVWIHENEIYSKANTNKTHLYYSFPYFWNTQAAIITRKSEMIIG